MAKEELEDIIEYEDYEADYIEEPEELSDNDKVVQNSKGQVKFKSVNHSKRAEANEVETDGEIELIDITNKDGIRVYRRGLIFIVCMAFKELFPKASSPTADSRCFPHYRRADCTRSVHRSSM